MSTLDSAAEKMDGIYRRQRFIYDITRRYYLLGRDRLISGLDVPRGGSVLEIGCGTARNLILTARRYPEARCYGIDVSAEMLRTARTSVVNAGVGERVLLASGDATSFYPQASFGVAVFDRVFISYTLSMIPAWRKALDSALACVAPGGSLHIADFGDFAGYPGWARWLQHHWLQRFSVTPIPGLAIKLETIAARQGFKPFTARLYGGYAVIARLERPAYGTAPAPCPQTEE